MVEQHRLVYLGNTQVDLFVTTMSQLVFAQRQQVKDAMSTLEDAFNELDTCYKDRCDQLQASVDSLTKIVETKDSTIERLLKLSCVVCCDFAYFFFSFFFTKSLCFYYLGRGAPGFVDDATVDALHTLTESKERCMQCVLVYYKFM